MKSSIWIILFCFAVSLASLFAGGNKVLAQDFAHIDSEYILSEVPEYEGVEQRLETLTEGWRDEIQEMEREIEELKDEFEAREILFTPEVREQRQNEIDSKIQEKEQFIESIYGPDGEYYQQQEELLEPIQQRILEAVVEVAERNNYDYIFDRSGDYIFLYASQSLDVSNEVLREMGIQVDEEEDL